ncbi:hypothetical protein C0J52_09208 [Blattella germanica]|nr:hypothetical protein C0J52_09208 [Blattella germanica]
MDDEIGPPPPPPRGGMMSDNSDEPSIVRDQSERRRHEEGHHDPRVVFELQIHEHAGRHQHEVTSENGEWGHDTEPQRRELPMDQRVSRRLLRGRSCRCPSSP